MDELGELHDDHVFLRRDALEFGYEDRDLRAAMRDGVISRIRHGAYVARAIWGAADSLEQHRLRSHAVLRSHKTELALSHTSAAVEHGLRLHKPDLDKIHVVALHTALARTTPDVVYHRMPVRDAELRLGLDGVLAVDPLRAALETASLSSVASGLVILDGVVDQNLATMDELHVARERYRGPGSRKLQITARLVRPGAESMGESLGRHLCWRQHLPEPRLQFEVYDGNGVLVGRVDYAWPEYGLLGEFDGLVKYHRFRRPGESIEQAVIREKQREDLLREITGWLMIRLIWADLYRPIVTAARIRDQLTRGRALLAG